MITHEDQDDITLHATNVNKLSPDLETVNTLPELEALQIFTHIPDATERTTANNTLLGRLGGLTLPFAEMSFHHTQGVFDNYMGKADGSVIRSSWGGGITGQGDLILNPNGFWQTLDYAARALRLRVYTNIVANDASSAFNPHANGIIGYHGQAYKTGPNSGTSGQRSFAAFTNAGALDWSGTDIPGVVPGTPVASATANIGDPGTYFVDVEVWDDGLVTNMIGNNAPFGNYWFIIGMQVAASCVTKTYKFKFELEYEKI